MTHPTFTREKMREIARSTKRSCSPNGYGHQIVVFTSGLWQEATGPNDCVAIQLADGSWLHPLCRFKEPMSTKRVAEAIAAAWQAIDDQRAAVEELLLEGGRQ